MVVHGLSEAVVLVQKAFLGWGRPQAARLCHAGPGGMAGSGPWGRRRGGGPGPKRCVPAQGAPCNDIHSVGGDSPGIPGEGGTGAHWHWEQPSATRTALLLPVLSSCKLGERSWSQVQGKCCDPWIRPCCFHSNQHHPARPW